LARLCLGLALHGKSDTLRALVFSWPLRRGSLYAPGGRTRPGGGV